MTICTFYLYILEPEDRLSLRRDEYDVLDGDVFNRRRRRGRSLSPDADSGYGYNRPSHAGSYPSIDSNPHYSGFHYPSTVYPCGMHPLMYSPVLASGGNPVIQSTSISQGAASGIQMVPQLILTPASPVSSRAQAPNVSNPVSSNPSSYPSGAINTLSNGASTSAVVSSDTKSQTVHASTAQLAGSFEESKIIKEQNRQISMLIKELDETRALNNKVFTSSRDNLVTYFQMPNKR